MKALTLSGNTLSQTEWNIEDILNETSKEDLITRMVDDQWFETISTCGLTYGEIRRMNEYSLR
jgi:hypothetical protein